MHHKSRISKMSGFSNIDSTYHCGGPHYNLYWKSCLGADDRYKSTIGGSEAKTFHFYKDARNGEISSICYSYTVQAII